MFVFGVSVAFAYDTHAPSIEDLNRAIAINPDSADAYYDRGILLEKQGNVPQAISDFTQTIKINPQDVDAYYSRGNAYAQQHHFTQAIADYNKVIEINPHQNK